LTDVEIEPDNKKILRYGCGDCHLCIKKCPAAAIDENGVDARRCISYLTIEKRTELSEEEKKITGDWIFGCDECLNVCPYRNKSLLPKEPTLLGIKRRKQSPIALQSL